MHPVLVPMLKSEAMSRPLYWHQSVNRQNIPFLFLRVGQYGIHAFWPVPSWTARPQPWTHPTKIQEVKWRPAVPRAWGAAPPSRRPETHPASSWVSKWAPDLQEKGSGPWEALGEHRPHQGVAHLGKELHLTHAQHPWAAQGLGHSRCLRKAQDTQAGETSNKAARRCWKS